LMGCMGLFATLSWAGNAREDTIERFHSAVEVLHAIMEAPDKGVPEEVLSNAKCIMVVPNLIKVASSSAASTAAESRPAAPPMVGARQRSCRLAAEAGDCRSASKALT
jgi:hypothetical protein